MSTGAAVDDPPRDGASTPTGFSGLPDALARITAGAAARDADPARRFPREAFAVLGETGALAGPHGHQSSRLMPSRYPPPRTVCTICGRAASGSILRRRFFTWESTLRS